MGFKYTLSLMFPLDIEDLILIVLNIILIRNCIQQFDFCGFFVDTIDYQIGSSFFVADSTFNISFWCIVTSSNILFARLLCGNSHIIFLYSASWLCQSLTDLASAHFSLILDGVSSFSLSSMNKVWSLPILHVTPTFWLCDLPWLSLLEHCSYGIQTSLLELVREVSWSFKRVSNLWTTLVISLRQYIIFEFLTALYHMDENPIAFSVFGKYSSWDTTQMFYGLVSLRRVHDYSLLYQLRCHWGRLACTAPWVRPWCHRCHAFSFLNFGHQWEAHVAHQIKENLGVLLQNNK